MSVPGGYFQPEEFFSPARFNRKTNTHLPGTDISALSPTYPNQIVICTSTGSGFTADTLYMRNSANTAWIGGGGGSHLHDQATDAAGGLFSNILHANLAKVYWDNVMTPTVGQFQSTTSGGASISDVHPTVVLNSGTTNGAWAQLGRPGVGVSFTGNSRFIARLFTSHDVFITARMGVYAEHVNDAPTNTPSKYGLEVCDSAGTPRDWDLFSSNGTTRTAQGTIADIAEVTPVAYRLDYTVATDIKFYRNGTLSATKTSNVPAGGGSINGRTMGLGVKTNTSGAGTNRIITLSGMAFAGVPSTTAWS